MIVVSGFMKSHVRLLFVTSFVINVQLATSSYCSFLTNNVSQMRTCRIYKNQKRSTHPPLLSIYLHFTSSSSKQPQKPYTQTQ